MTAEQMAKRIAQLEAENKALKTKEAMAIRFKVAETTGKVSVYFGGRFPLTAHRKTWEAIASRMDDLVSFCQSTTEQQDRISAAHKATKRAERANPSPIPSSKGSVRELTKEDPRVKQFQDMIASLVAGGMDRDTAVREASPLLRG